MTRQLLTALRNEITTLIPDNTSAQVSPADVRNTMLDIIDSCTTQSAWINTATVASAFNMTTAAQIPPMPSPTSGTQIASFVTIDGTTRQFTLKAPAVGFSLLVECGISMDMPNGAIAELRLFANGVATGFSAQMTSVGTGKPSSMNFVAYIPVAAAGTMDMRVTGVSGAFQANILNSSMIVSVLPTA